MSSSGTIKTITLPNGSTYDVNEAMTGATSSVAGASGLVPAPSAGDDTKFLRGDGTWVQGGKPMVILSYGSSTWQDFIDAYNSNVIVYCRASSNTNPATGAQTRMAFMAYINASPPTEVEFQYYRSVSSHSDSQQGDQVFVYKLNSSSTWSVTKREAFTKMVAGSNLTSTYSSGTLTINGNYSAFSGADGTNAGATGLVPAPTATDNTKYLKGDGTWANIDALPTVTSSDNGKVLEVVSGAWAVGSEKAPTTSPVFTGSISLGRKANTTVGTNSFAVGIDVTASGAYSHAEGNTTNASGAYSHAEGQNSIASGMYAHAEGNATQATGARSHSEGEATTASKSNSHSEGEYTTASGSRSHVEGLYTTANHASQHVFGEYNVNDNSTAASTARGNYVEIVGNGASSSAKSNARTLDWNGNERLMGDIYVGCNADSTGGKKITPMPSAPSSDGDYYLKCTVSSGTPTYSWVTIPAANGVSF